MTDQIGAGRKAGARFGGFLRDNSYVWLAFFASAALMLFMWFCNQMIPFGGRTILRIDLYHQYGPLFAELFERLRAGRSLLYSWDSGLGGGFLGNFFNYLSSPTGLLVLLFGHERVPEAIGVMVLLKCAFASGAFAYLLRKVHNRSDASTAAFGVLYSFCGWMIVYYWNVMWLDGMALLPLVMLGIWSIVHKRKFMLYTVTLALTLVTNYFMGYMVCIFSVLFFLVTFFSGGNADNGLSPPAPGKKRLRDSRFLRAGLTFAYASVLGAALAAVALLPVYMTLKSSSATSGSFPDKLSTNFQIFDFLVNHFADVNPAWRGSGPNVLPNVYCGVGTLLLVPLYLFAPKIKAREKAAHVLLLLFLFFSFNTNILNYVWHGMHFPNDLPYRFSFLYSFLLLWIAYKVFLHLKDIPLRAIVAVGAGAALFAVLAEKVGSQNILTGTANADKNTGATIYITLAFLVVYTLLFAFVRRSPKAKSVSLAMVLLCCVITEVCAADVKNFEITQEKVNYTTDLKDFQWVKSKLEAQDASFFRMELTDRRTSMDPAWYDYRGVTVFSSMAGERTANLENRLGLGGNFINSYHYNPNTPVYNAMHNLKYVVENMSAEPDGSFVGPHGSSYLPELESSGMYTKRGELTRARFTVFENNYYLPIGFWASNRLRDWETSVGTNPFRVQGDFWDLAGAGAGVFEPLTLRLSDDFYGEGGFTASTSEQYVSFSGKPANQQVKIPCVLEVEEPQNVYIMTDSRYVSAIQVRRPDGGFADRSHDTQAIWDLGLVTPEEPLSLELCLDGKDAPADGGFNAYVYGLDMETFVRGYNTLRRGELEVARFSDTMIEGTIAAQADGLLYTSIPYDEGWQVSIDGKRVPVSKYVGIGNEDEYKEEGKLKKLWAEALIKLAVRLDPDAAGETTLTRSKNKDSGDSEVISRGYFRHFTPSKEAGWLCRRIAIHLAKLYKPVKGGLLGVPMPAGEHTVTLRYVPRGLNGGMLISAAALILLALTGLFGELLRRRKRGYVPAPPVPEVPNLFSTENLNPEDFSLGEPWEAPPAEEPEPPPEETAFPAEMEAAEEFAPSAEPGELPDGEEETFELNLPDPPEDEPADAGAASINAILQEMQARAEELRRKMQLESAPGEDDDDQSFKLV